MLPARFFWVSRLCCETITQAQKALCVIMLGLLRGKVGFFLCYQASSLLIMRHSWSVREDLVLKTPTSVEIIIPGENEGDTWMARSSSGWIRKSCCCSTEQSGFCFTEADRNLNDNILDSHVIWRRKSELAADARRLTLFLEGSANDLLLLLHSLIAVKFT